MLASQINYCISYCAKGSEKIDHTGRAFIAIALYIRWFITVVVLPACPPQGVT